MYIYGYIYTIIYVYVCVCVCARKYMYIRGLLIQVSCTAIKLECFLTYGVATISRLLKIIGLFCRILSL